MSHRWTEADEELPSAPTARVTRERAAALETRALLAQANQAYAPYSCPASGECCQLATTQREPWLVEPEWRLLEDELRRQARDLPAAREDGGCPFLDAPGKRCTVYAARPLGCRTFFCGRRVGPEGHPRDEVIRLSKRLEAVAERLSLDAAELRPLTAWWASARAAAG